MQLPENNTQRAALDALMSQLGTFSLNSTHHQHVQPSPFTFVRPTNNPLANMSQNVRISQPNHHGINQQPLIPQPPQQQSSQQPIRLVYTNPSNTIHQPNMTFLGSQGQPPFQTGQQIPIPNPNHVPFSIQQNAVGHFQASQPVLHTNSNSMIPNALNHLYGTQIQVKNKLKINPFKMIV